MACHFQAVSNLQEGPVTINSDSLGYNDRVGIKVTVTRVMEKRKMSWKDVTETLGVLGVIGSLIFVAFQIQQNTNAVRGATIQAILDRSFDSVVLSVENADLRAAHQAACDGTLTADQRVHLMFFYRAVLRLQLNRFFQVQLGIIDEETALKLGGRGYIFTRPIFAELWGEAKSEYSPEFQAFIEREVLPLSQKTC